MPRLFGPTPHGTLPNEVLEFDYLEVDPNATEDKYVLLDATTIPITFDIFHFHPRWLILQHIPLSIGVLP